MKKIPVLLILILCIGLMGCSSGNTDKGNKNTPVPVQTDKDTEKGKEDKYYPDMFIGWTLSEDNNLVEIDGKTLTEVGVFNADKVTKDLIGMMNAKLDMPVIDRTYKVLEYQGDYLFDLDLNGKKVSEILPYILGEEPFRFDANVTGVNQNPYYGAFLCEDKDYKVFYNKTDNGCEIYSIQYRVFTEDTYYDYSWFFLDEDITERINYNLHPVIINSDGGCYCGCGNDDLSDCVNTCTDKDCDHPENVSE